MSGAKDFVIPAGGGKRLQPASTRAAAPMIGAAGRPAARQTRAIASRNRGLVRSPGRVASGMAARGATRTAGTARPGRTARWRRVARSSAPTKKRHWLTTLACNRTTRGGPADLSARPCNRRATT